jgi:5-methylthioadenosine/S-adenosylhomocysteine deaminase
MLKRAAGALLAIVSVFLDVDAQRISSVDLLITGAAVATMDPEGHVYNKGYVAIKNGRILAVGEGAPPPARFRAAKTIDGSGKAVLPGLINTHTHIPMVLFRGIADDLDLQEWLTKFIFPAEAKNVDKQFVIDGTRLGLVEMIRGGTTTYVDMYYFEDAIAYETKHAGLRAVLGETLIDFPAPDNKTWPDAVKSTDEFLRKWAKDPLIVAAVAPHSTYTVSGDHLKESQKLAEKYDAPVVIHIAEAPTETEFMQKTYQTRTIPYLERLGLLSARVIAAHVVHVNDAEIEILRERNVGIGHCPQSNMKLASGVAPVPAMLRKNLRLGLGTDGAASNNDLNMWEEMDSAAKLHKLVSKDPTVVTARDALTMATIGGARAIHLEKEIGSLEVGKKADLIVVDLSGAHTTPLYNLYSHLVYAAKASDVTDTIVNGRVLMRDRRLLTLDELAIKARARVRRDQVARSLK